MLRSEEKIVRNQIISAAALTPALAPTHTSEFTTNLAAAAAYPELNNATDDLPPVLATASNITASDTNSHIAPPLPMPSADPDATPLHYMRDARASVDWAVSQLPSFGGKIRDWFKTNIDVRVEDLPPPATHNPIIAVEKSEFPLTFNVEAGAYIDAIRTSLDLLAAALAYRHGVTRPDKAHFPILNSAEEFHGGKYQGHEFVAEIPASERKIIEFLRPYKGGYETLWLLHHLNLTRKHKRFLATEISPLRLSLLNGEPVGDDFTPIKTGCMRVQEKTVLGLVRKGAPDYEMKFTPFIALNEPGFAEGIEITAVLKHFACHAQTIISLFDR